MGRSIGCPRDLSRLLPALAASCKGIHSIPAIPARVHGWCARGLGGGVFRRDLMRGAHDPRTVSGVVSMATTPPPEIPARRTPGHGAESCEVSCTTTRFTREARALYSVSQLERKALRNSVRSRFRALVGARAMRLNDVLESNRFESGRALLSETYRAEVSVPDHVVPLRRPIIH